jgi:hypothetical protein
MRPGRGRDLAQVGPAGGEPVAVALVDRTGGDEGRDLPQRVPGEGDRGLADRVADRLPRHERCEQHGELARAGGRELVGAGVEEEAGQRAAGGGFGFADDPPRAMIRPRPACAGRCSSLSREDGGERHE